MKLAILSSSFDTMNFLASEAKRDPLMIAAQIVAGILVFLAFLLLIAGFQKLFQWIGGRSSPQKQDLLRIVSNLVRVLLILIGAFCALATAGVDVSALVAGLGLTGFALGFALRDALSNFLAGALILIYRPFRRGDKIKVKDYEGIVIEIDLRYTTLQGEHKKFLIPNATMLTEPVTLFNPPKH